MDLARDPAILRRKQLRRIAYAIAALLVVAVVSVALARMEPAAPTVDRATLLIDTVKRGPFVRQVRGLGTLVPEDTRWLPATTEGRIERIVLRPGATVRPDSIILELSNPQVEQEALNARLALQSAEAALENLRVQLQNDLLTQQSQMASIEAEYKQAQMDAETNDALAAQKLVSSLLQRQSELRASTLRARYEIEKKRYAMASDSIDARTRVQQAAVDQARAVSDLQQTRLADLKVRPGFAGVLQQVPVEVGQRVGPGQNLARVADPGRLKAELKIAETQAKDVELGQLAYIDTRNGIITGRVSRKDPAAVSGTVTVDVSLTEALPRGAVPDLGVDGTIELERIASALQVGRTAFGQEQSTVALFKIVDAAGNASRVQVRVGRSSVNTLEILSGLNEGDRVVLSDMSAWDSVDRVRLR
ncbi:MAG TPA: HlyD family efflux transporter periplasmic adaptor subunit [Gemmatimonadaceae bacterium]|nr:HlyD family efflux transporter periplasmic adaptor subunit [Gemmatimonadaceae bacterium]